MELDEAFARALKELRVGANLVQEDFVDVISREALSLLERGQRTPKLSQIDSIAAKIGVHPLTLIARCYLVKSPEHSLEEVVARMRRELQILEKLGANPFSER